jgi:hypothetical protein
MNLLFSVVLVLLQGAIKGSFCSSSGGLKAILLLNIGTVLQLKLFHFYSEP